MMEGLNTLGQEEYIWAMRTINIKTDSDVFKQYWAKSKSGIEISPADIQTRIMASLVPDEVIHHVDDYNHRQYDACFLFGDVSGFTELCEKYTKTGISGPSRMTQVLNKYLGSMVQEVMSHGGDVLKFSGDAFIAIFKSSETESIRDAVHEAIDCALVIQKNYGSYLTDVGVAIRVKLAISAGLVTFALIGNINNSHYVVVGKAIWDVKAAESISSAGDIIVAPAAWHYVSNTNEYLYEDVKDHIHVKILGVGPNWRSVQKTVRHEQVEEDINFENNLSGESSSSQEDDLSDIVQETGEEFSVRPAVNLAVKLKIKEALRKFIIVPVMKCLDMDEPLEYLTEMRLTVIVFINVISYPLENEEIVILADKTYNIVCSVVDKMNGCVNKVSLFDKDLMFVVIFGLRGLKHELECQVALRCAKQCHSAINELPGVLSTSIGVTTGKTYCGIFGHTLRREYTVISLVVNKAARIMVAYKGKVTCDRETFLHSKLESKHFILQEFKPLKGISHPGPIYEFREVEIEQDVPHKLHESPLLGRGENIKLYKNLLVKYLYRSGNEDIQYKMLLITGEARQGKTRLLDELVYITPTKAKTNQILLNKHDYNIPYQTLRLIFYMPLSLTRESSPKEREQSLLNVLKQIQFPEVLCVLNDVFAVNFNVSEEYMLFDETQKMATLRKVVKQLVYSCFVTLWVIAIDDIDFIDQQSVELLNIFFELNTVFIVATKSRIDKLVRSENYNRVFHDSRVKNISLKPIERWYLGALACQILDVYAISPQLENAIQTRSNGNPGWTESYLISLLQDKAIYIVRANLSQINDLGLVCPPLYMMARFTDDQRRLWEEIMEERKPSSDSTRKHDDWKRFIDCCRDSHLNVTIRERMEKIPHDYKVPTCVISREFSIGDQEMELSMDVLILKTFDSLSFFEQLLVKCSAILGYQFSRDMLHYVMIARNKRTLALAVQKLFEIKVLTCAKGDFLEGGIFQEKLYSPHEEHVSCYCRGIKVDETCTDLPKYASCGYMQFQSSLFRDITYNLLTDHQKKEFHLRAIRYLERETRRCKACGNKVFQRILGVKIDQELLKRREKYKKSSTEDDNVDSQSDSRRTSVHSGSLFSASVGTEMTSRASISAYSVGGPRRSKISEEKKSLTSLSYLNQLFSKKKAQNFLGITLINKLKHSFSLTRAFSTEDFTDCQCSLILCTTYAQLIEHGLGAGELAKTIQAMLEYAYLCIVVSNLALAMKVLDEALKVVGQKAKERAENMWKLSLIRAKIFILKGYSRLELGHLDKALANLHRALEEYEITFPRGLTKKIKIYVHELRHFVTMFVFTRIKSKHLDHWRTIYANNLSECLSHLCTLYMIKGEWDNAEMAAAWSLSKALDSFSDFQVICIAFANMISIAQHFQRWSVCMALEINSLRLCHMKTSEIEAEDLKCVCKLYVRIFFSRLQRSDIEKATQIGYIVLRLGISVKAFKIVLPVLPLLIHVLLCGQHFSNAFSVLQELNFYSEDDVESSGKVWYFALCQGLHIETGYTIVPYHTCENFSQFEGERWVTVNDPDARKRFYIVMWLWCMRNEQIEAASIWSAKFEDFTLVTEKDSLADKITSLYILEGLIIFLVVQIDKRNINAILTAVNEVKVVIRALENVAKKTKLILPRLYHLKAYFRHVTRNDSKVTDLMNKATRYAKKLGNSFEVAWIQHSLKAWNKTLSPEAVNFWKEHSENYNVASFEDIQANLNVGFYTLPTPLFL